MTKPDKFEKGVRLGCGFVFGLFVGVFGIGWAFYDSGYSAVAMAAIAVAVLCAFAALKFGDRFWHWLKDHWYWWS